MKKTVIFLITIFLINVSVVVAETTVEEEIRLGDCVLTRADNAKTWVGTNAFTNTASAHYEKAKVLLLKKLVDKICSE